MVSKGSAGYSIQPHDNCETGKAKMAGATLAEKPERLQTPQQLHLCFHASPATGTMILSPFLAFLA